MRLTDRLRETGDTIVEVLVAIAVISAVVGTAYAITNRSVQTNQTSQERGQATKEAEAQLETLKLWVGDPAKRSQVFLEEKFCFAPNSSTSQMEVVSFPAPTPVPTNNNTDYPAECRKGFYNIGFLHETGTELFTIYVTWDGPKGTRENLSMAYKVYQ